MGQQERTEDVWIQRIDPLAVFLPLIILGIVGIVTSFGSTVMVLLNLAIFESTAIGLDLLIMDIFPMSAQIILVTTLVIGLLIGFVLSRHLENIVDPFLKDGHVQFQVSGLRYAIIIVIVFAIIGSSVYTLYDAAIVALGQVLTTGVYVLAFAVLSPIGIKFSLDYYEINGHCYIMNSSLEAYLCGSAPSPELVDYVSSAVGGSSLQMFDRRVKSVILKMHDK